MNTYTKLLRIGTQQQSLYIYIYCRLQSEFFPQIISNLMSELKICTKRKFAFKKQNLKHKCILQESCKTVRRWQRYILLVRGDHGVDVGIDFFKQNKMRFMSCNTDGRAVLEL